MLKHSLLISAFIGLTACGGGGGAATPTPTPVNIAATFSGDSSGSVNEDDTQAVTGTLSVTDPDTNEASIQAQTDAAQTYGSFSIDTAGAWSYTLDNTTTRFKQ